MGNYSSSNFDNLHYLHSVLDETATDIAQVQTDVVDWHRAVTYLLQILEVKLMDIDLQHPKSFDTMLEVLMADMKLRLEEGGW